MKKKIFSSPKVSFVFFEKDEIICCSGVEPTKSIIKDEGSFGFNPTEKL